MPFVVKFNGGSFVFEDLNYFLTAVVISTTTKCKSAKEVFSNISNDDHAIRAELVNVVFSYPVPSPSDSNSLDVISAVLSRKLVQKALCHMSPDKQCEAVVHAVEMVKGAFIHCKFFPSTTQCDFSEMYRLIHDKCNLIEDAASRLHTDYSAEQAKNLARFWNGARAASAMVTSVARPPASPVKPSRFTAALAVQEAPKESDSAKGSGGSVDNAQVDLSSSIMQPKLPLITEVGPSVKFNEILPEFQAYYSARKLKI